MIGFAFRSLPPRPFLIERGANLPIIVVLSSLLRPLLMFLLLELKPSPGRTSPNVALNRLVSLMYRSRWGIPVLVPIRKGDGGCIAFQFRLELVPRSRVGWADEEVVVDCLLCSSPAVGTVSGIRFPDSVEDRVEWGCGSFVVG